MTNNTDLIARLVRYVDVFNPEDKSITTYTVVQTLLHRAMGGAVASDQYYSRDHRSLEVALEDLIRTVYPRGYRDPRVLSELMNEMDDLVLNAND